MRRRAFWPGRWACFDEPVARMTEEIASTPGWVEERADEVLAGLPKSPAITAARNAYMTCLAGSKQPGAPSDTLGSEFSRCRGALHKALQAEGVASRMLDPALDALEAELAAGS